MSLLPDEDAKSLVTQLGPRLLEHVDNDTGAAGVAECATAEKLADADVVGVYFSAHWCPPCRQFTPMLAQLYTMLRAAGKKFEVVFVSADKSESDFDAYFGEMPWLALPYVLCFRKCQRVRMG